MNRTRTIVVSLVTSALALFPILASAHEHATYKIGSNYYQFVVGSLNEPIAVDDKTGVDLTVTRCANSTCMAAMSADGDMDGPAGVPVTGLEQTLKVELQAGGQKKMLALTPVYGQDGSYSATFYPTVSTTFTYRIVGTINNTDVDVSFSCLPEGTPKAADDTSEKQISSGVTQTKIGGGFGCPKPKEDLGFPAALPSLANTSVALGSTQGTANGALAISLMGIVLAGYTFWTTRTSK